MVRGLWGWMDELYDLGRVMGVIGVIGVMGQG